MWSLKELVEMRALVLEVYCWWEIYYRPDTFPVTQTISNGLKHWMKSTEQKWLTWNHNNKAEKNSEATTSGHGSADLSHVPTQHVGESYTSTALKQCDKLDQRMLLSGRYAEMMLSRHISQPIWRIQGEAACGLFAD